LQHQDILRIDWANPETRKILEGLQLIVLGLLSSNQDSAEEPLGAQRSTHEKALADGSARPWSSRI
jgi:hypothetical protein